MKNITVFGTGYVGLVTGACFADKGYQVICVDVDENKINQLHVGQAPFYEPGLDVLLTKNQQAKRLHFTTDASAALLDADVIVIAVGTPQQDNGKADLRYVEGVAEQIAQSIQQDALIIVKSTVPVGSCERLCAHMQGIVGDKIAVRLASNPEFLRQGSAVKDCLTPDRIIVGSPRVDVQDALRELYQPWIVSGVPMVVMNWASSELSKYAANAFLATKISFINEMSAIAEQAGADIEQIREAMGLDARINPEFLYAGCGFGGSCFPKDIRALEFLAGELQVETPILRAVDVINERQKNLLFHRMESYFDDLKGKTIACWGLAFKPNTDDMREAPSRVLIEKLLSSGAVVQVYDPKAQVTARQCLPQHKQLIFSQTAEHALDNADALLIVTEWQEFREFDLQTVKNKLRIPVVFDGRNLYDPVEVNALGLHYISIGREPI